jgi:hypothetical protein
MVAFFFNSQVTIMRKAPIIKTFKVIAKQLDHWYLTDGFIKIQKVNGKWTVVTLIAPF